MIYSREVEEMCPVAQGVHHGAAPIPEEAKWVQAKEVKDISGFTHGVGWCAPQQGACKLSLNVKEGIIPVSYTHLKKKSCAVSAKQKNFLPMTIWQILRIFVQRKTI